MGLIGLHYSHLLLKILVFLLYHAVRNIPTIEWCGWVISVVSLPCNGVPASSGVPTSHCCLHLLHAGSSHPIRTTGSQIANQK